MLASERIDLGADDLDLALKYLDLRVDTIETNVMVGLLMNQEPFRGVNNLLKEFFYVGRFQGSPVSLKHPIFERDVGEDGDGGRQSPGTVLEGVEHLWEDAMIPPRVWKTHRAGNSELELIKTGRFTTNFYFSSARDRLSGLLSTLVIECGNGALLLQLRFRNMGR